MSTLEHKIYQVPLSKIDYDDENPRGESEETILNDPGFQDLISSIKKYGLLEPLIIKNEIKEEFDFKLIDGERRYRACKELKLEEVPALIAASHQDGKILAYQIHMHRKNWSKIAEVKSIKGIVNNIKELNPGIDNEKLIKEVIKKTNAPKKKAAELILLTKYNDSIIENVFNKKIDISYLIETEKILIPKLKKYPDFFNFIPRYGIRESIAHKAYNNLLGGTRYLRKIHNSSSVLFIDVLDNSLNKEGVKELLLNFIADFNLSVDSLISQYKVLGTIAPKNFNDNPPVEPVEVKEDPSGKKDEDNSQQTETIEQKQTEKAADEQTPENITQPKDKPKDRTNYHNIKLTAAQQTSIKDIQVKFNQIGKTFSNEELNYITEALNCLGNGCLKASVLMIWSSFISRLLIFIEKDLQSFNTLSKEMKIKDKSFYKHWSKNFMFTVSDIEEIRESSKDMQVICYICYLNLIDKTQFDKFKNYYQYRNNCAHPTNIDLSINEVIALFELILESIFKNKKIS